MGWAEGINAALQSYMKTGEFLDEQQRRKDDSAFKQKERSRLEQEWAMEDQTNEALRTAALDVKTRYSAKDGQRVTPEFIKSAMPGVDESAADELTGALQNLDPANAAEVVKQYQQHYAQQPQQALNVGSTPATAMTPTPGAPAPKKAPSGFRAYKGDDGQMYMTASEEYQPRPSEIMFEQAEKLMSLGNQKSLALGAQLQQQAMQSMQQETMSEVQEALALPDLNSQVRGVLEVGNRHPAMAGTVDMQPGDQPGTFKIIHTVPGREKPHVSIIKASSPEEVPLLLAQKIMMRTDPKLFIEHKKMESQLAKDAMEMKKDEHGMTLKDREFDVDKDYKMGMLGVQQGELAQRKYESNREYGLRLKAHNRQEKEASARANREKWKEIGTDANGNVVLRDELSGQIKVEQTPPGVTLFPRTSGIKGAAEAPQGEKANSDGSMTRNGRIYDPVQNEDGDVVSWQPRMTQDEVEAKFIPDPAKVAAIARAARESKPAPARKAAVPVKSKPAQKPRMSAIEALKAAKAPQN